MTKNQRTKYKNFKSSQDNDNNAPEKHESVCELLKIETPGFNSKDFPELKASSKSRGNAVGSQACRSGLHTKKTFLSVVSKSHVKNLNEAFPALHEFEYKKVNGSNLKSEKDDRKLQTISANENSDVLENAVTSNEPLAPEKNREIKTNPSQKVIIPPRRNPHKKKRSDPIEFSFQDIFALRKPLNKTRKSNIFKRKSQRHENKEVLSGNYLDSSNPKRSRGKHREIEKKKPTKLKLAIIKERIIRQKMKENSIDSSECFRLIETLDFKMEIKTYLEKLNKRKTAKSGSVGGGNQVNSVKKIEDVNSAEVVPKERSPVREQKEKKIVEILSEPQIKFTSKFREYCDNILTPSLNSSVSELVKELVKLQDRGHARDPIKAKAKRRHVSGLREINKYLALKKVKLVVIAPNLEKVQMEGGVYDIINKIKSTTDAQSVPCVFALDRYSLGRCTRKNVPVSAFAVLNYEGLEELFEKTLSHLKEAKERFIELSKGNTKVKENEEEEEKEKEKENTGIEDVNARIIDSFISAFREELHLGQSKENFQSEEE